MLKSASYLVLIAGVAVLVLAGTAAGHERTTNVRQGGVVVGWVIGGAGTSERGWSYCDNQAVAYDGFDGRLYVDTPLTAHGTPETLGWAIRTGTNGWKVWANPELTGGRTVLVGSVIRQSSFRWNIVRTARQPRDAQWVRIKPRLVAQAMGRDGVAAGASFLLQFGTCRG